MTGSGAGTVATVGTFDGIHRGHQAVLAEIVRRARVGEGGRGEGRGGLESLLVTFDPHPLEVLNPSAAPRLLTLPGEKRALVRALGVGRIEIVPFTPELARLGPEEFVRDVLRAQFAMQQLVLGYDHRSEEHTSELQSRLHLVCRLLLEKKKKLQIMTELARI